MTIPGTPAVLGTQGMGKTEGLQCDIGDSENPRNSFTVLGTQGLGKTEELQCCVGDSDGKPGHE